MGQGRKKKRPSTNAFEAGEQSRRARAREIENDWEAGEQSRRAKLRRLQKDSAFIIETEKMEAKLSEFKRANPAAFRRFFQRFGYPALFRPGKVETILRESVEKPEEQDTLRDYIRYASRFQVWLRPRNNSFEMSVQAPFESKFRVDLVDGRCQSADPDVVSDSPEVIFEDLYADDNVEVPDTNLADLLGAGKAKLVQLDDKKGRSVLNEIESFAYDPAALTFILHKSEKPYVFVLVGEKVAMDTTWKAAGKVVNALQKKLYGRSKAGRPRNIPKLRKAIKVLKRNDGRSQKQKAYAELDPNPAKSTRSPEVYLSQVRAKITP
jgi:hypothetical protein